MPERIAGQAKKCRSVRIDTDRHLSNYFSDFILL